MTKQALDGVNAEISAIESRIDALHPDFDADVIEYWERRLDDLIEVLETSARQSRIRESGLELIQGGGKNTRKRKRPKLCLVGGAA
jgi:hypothetical protein